MSIFMRNFPKKVSIFGMVGNWGACIGRGIWNLRINNRSKAQQSGFAPEEEMQRNGRDLAQKGQGERYGTCADAVTRLVCIFALQKSRSNILRLFIGGAGDEARLHFSSLLGKKN